MRVTRILDLIVLLLLATVLLMPLPDATVKPALALDAERLDRVAELQSRLAGKPDDGDAGLELANIYLDGHRPDWALATIGPFARARPDDYRFQQLRAIAYADRFDSAPAVEAAPTALALCEGAPAGKCDDAVHARLTLLRAALRSVDGVDMKDKPYLAKDRIFHELHPAWVPTHKVRPQAPGQATTKAQGKATEKPVESP
jgi:hypothetical protein